MNYKETLFFIGKCLTITHEEHNRILIEKEIKSDKVDWDNIVKLSTKHYVFPALYCNLKRADFLHYLPEELVSYMKHITDLNRKRNLQIIEQAKEINKLLLTNNIRPIFLKGTGNLLEGLYDDIAERMVSDIDILTKKVDCKRAFEILQNDGYNHKNLELFQDHRHLPRLINSNKMTAIEIHKELLIEKYAHEFNYSLIEKGVISTKRTSCLSYKNQLSLSIIANQINDDGQYFKTIALRNSYDVYLLSLKVNSLVSIKGFRKLFNPLNNYLALCKLTLNSNRIEFKETSKASKNLIYFNKLLSRKKTANKRIRKQLFAKKRIEILFKSLYKKEYRTWLFIRLTKGRQH